MKELNQTLVELAKKLPSTDAGIEAGELITRAVMNITNESFKLATIAYIKQKFKGYV